MKAEEGDKAGTTDQVVGVVMVFVHEAGKPAKVLRIAPTDLLAEALEIAGVLTSANSKVLAGKPTGELLSDADDAHAPTSAGTKVGDVARDGHLHVHVHPCSTIAVSVNYGSATHRRNFSPSRSVADVRSWAIDRFKIDDAAADKLVLELSDSDTRPRPEEHLSDLATDGPRCEVSFDLVQSEAWQG